VLLASVIRGLFEGHLKIVQQNAQGKSLCDFNISVAATATNSDQIIQMKPPAIEALATASKSLEPAETRFGTNAAMLIRPGTSRDLKIVQQNAQGKSLCDFNISVAATATNSDQIHTDHAETACNRGLGNSLEILGTRGNQVRDECSNVVQQNAQGKSLCDFNISVAATATNSDQIIQMTGEVCYGCEGWPTTESRQDQCSWHQ
jgi:hypothetical protein